VSLSQCVCVCSFVYVCIIVSMAYSVESQGLLKDLLLEIKRVGGDKVDFARLLPTLKLHARSEGVCALRQTAAAHRPRRGMTCSLDSTTKRIALEWISTFMDIPKARADVIIQTPEIVSVFLQSLPSSAPRVPDLAREGNEKLRALIEQHEREEHGTVPHMTASPSSSSLPVTTPTTPSIPSGPDSGSNGDSTTSARQTTFPLSATVDEVLKLFTEQSVETRSAALSWILMLHTCSPVKVLLRPRGACFPHVRHSRFAAWAQMSTKIDEFFSPLLKMLNDQSDVVVVLDLRIIAQISCFDVNTNSITSQPSSHFFARAMKKIYELFASDSVLLEKKSPFIIRQLCVLLTPFDVYGEFAVILLNEKDSAVARTMVQNLNNILLTSSELHGFRQRLSDLTVPVRQYRG
jgi:vacuole morphology and inheritance protein 14